MSIRRLRLDQAPDQVTAREPFRASELSGWVVRSTFEVPQGKLPEPLWDQLIADVNLARSMGGQTYVVLSFQTPIAWTLVSGDLFVPDVRYSSRTTRHQNVLRGMRSAA